MANVDPKVRAWAEQLTKKLVDDGLIIESGWQAFIIICKMESFPDVQLREMRKVWFAGSLHLFTSILVSLESGKDPTEKDMQRMNRAEVLPGRVRSPG
jgi:hypothetical protein